LRKTHLVPLETKLYHAILHKTCGYYIPPESFPSVVLIIG